MEDGRSLTSRYAVGARVVSSRREWRTLPFRRAIAVFTAVVVAAGCAVARSTFPSEPKAGTLFHTFTAPPGSGPFPAIVLLHTCGGIRGHISQWADRLAAHGYASVVVDSFTPRGGRACNIPDYFPATLDEVAADAFAALQHLKTRSDIDRRRIGVMGFSWGGGAVLRTSSARYRPATGGFGAAVAFYPVCVDARPALPPAIRARFDSLYDDIRTPTLILAGDADTETPPVECARTVERLRRAGRPVTIKIYPGAGHVFDIFDATATRDAADTMLRFFDENLERASVR